MKTRRLYLSLFTAFTLYWTVMYVLQILYITLAFMFGEWDVSNKRLSTEVVRHTFLFGGLTVCFAWEALHAHLEIRKARGRSIGSFGRISGGFVGVVVGLCGFGWAWAFILATRQTWKVLGPWVGAGDSFLIALGIGGAFYFLKKGTHSIRNRKVAV